MSASEDRQSPRTTRLLKRFYESVTVVEMGQDWAIRLDDRPVRTPAKAELAVPSRELAEALAGEWAAQGERIDPETMPLTRLVNSALDGVRTREQAVRDDIAAYAASDLLCYRADAPEGLVEKQCAAWDPVLAWAEKELGARFTPVAGVIHREQPADALERLAKAIESCDAFALTALHTITTLTGSALLALAHAHGALDADSVWNAAHVDEDWQISQWGEDAEAAARRAARRKEFDAAVGIVKLVK